MNITTMVAIQSLPLPSWASEQVAATARVSTPLLVVILLLGTSLVSCVQLSNQFGRTDIVVPVEFSEKSETSPLASESTEAVFLDATEADATSAASQVVLGLDSQSWAELFPTEYEQFIAPLTTIPKATAWGGSVAEDKLARAPGLKTVFAGSGFGVEYKEDRNHAYAWEDLTGSARVNARTPASCLSCKTADISTIYAEEGWAFAQKPLANYTSTGHNGISCATCHDPGTKKLRVIQPGFVDGLKDRGTDWESLDHKTQATLTCAQCHVEYYFEPGTNRVVHPLFETATNTEDTRGTFLAQDKTAGTATAMWTYYQTIPGGFTGDFTQPASNTRIVKSQHPDYEDFRMGTHATAGVSCADCHMPGGTHFVQSPLNNLEASCLECHADQGIDWLKERVSSHQSKVANAQDRTLNLLVQAHEAIAKAPSTTPAQNVTKAREALREAQWYWDYVASSNSMGFHNPAGALANLSHATELAQEARLALFEQWR